MVDVDGVVAVHSDPRGWAAGLEHDVGISADALHAVFFSQHWDDVIHGRVSMRSRLEPVLSTLSPGIRYEDFTGYWFSHDAHLNDALLAELAVLRSTGVEVHLATNQEHERARYLWHDLDLRSRFDGLHYSAELNHCKPDPGYYRCVEQRTSLRPDQLFFIDDTIANVQAAIACGWSAAPWTGKQTLGSLMAVHL